MGNILETCAVDGLLLSDVKLNNPSSTICIRKPVYYVAVGKGTNNNIVVSTDGNKWFGVGRSVISFCQGITYNNIQKKWVAVGMIGNNSIATSTNGYDWTGLGNTILTDAYNVKYANNLYIAVGKGLNSIATSTNGYDWTGLGNTILSRGNAIEYANGLWIIGGIDSSGGNYQIATSSNGTTWNKKNIYVGDVGPTGLSYGNGLWMAVCGNNNTIAKSTNNGDTWTKISLSIFSNCNDVFYSSNLWVAVGKGNNQIATSPDGNTWSGLGNTFFGTESKSVNYLNGIWFVCGFSSGKDTSIFSSSNGKNWSPKVSSTILSICTGIEYANP
jgi:hypothetical protein